MYDGVNEVFVLTDIDFQNDDNVNIDNLAYEHQIENYNSFRFNHHPNSRVSDRMQLTDDMLLLKEMIDVTRAKSISQYRTFKRDIPDDDYYHNGVRILKYSCKNDPRVLAFINRVSPIAVTMLPKF